jgi:hypothetical protein
MTQYKYISSIDYINNLEFDYVETYSLQRGREFEKNEKLISREYEKLKNRKNKIDDLTKFEEQRFTELDGLLGFTQYLINDKGQFHPSSKRINTFKATDPKIENLKSILRTKINEIPMWMCAPIYRDALAFYDKDNKIVSTLNVCLECQYMETEMFNHINGDYLTYDLLKRFFIEIGHEVENPDQFVWEELQKEMSKMSKKKALIEW